MNRGHHRDDCIDVQFQVQLRYRRRCFPVFPAVHLSPHGMYVRTPGLTLPRGTQVDIELKRWNREWRIAAVVMHSDIDGIDLMFREPQPELYRHESGLAIPPGRTSQSVTKRHLLPDLSSLDGR